jgi:hypothetical protein
VDPEVLVEQVERVQGGLDDFGGHEDRSLLAGRPSSGGCWYSSVGMCCSWLDCAKWMNFRLLGKVLVAGCGFGWCAAGRSRRRSG